MADAPPQTPFTDEIRESDRTRYLTLLFAREEMREDLATLYAFWGELSRIPALVSEPIPGEIRLQWWREVLEGQRQEEAAQNPLAVAVLRLIKRYSLPLQPFFAVLEARGFDLYHDPIETIAQMEGYAGQSQSALFQLSALILNEGRSADTADLAGYGGVALTLANFLAHAPYTLSKGQTYLPLEILENHGVTPASLHAGKPSDGADAMVRALCDLALDYLTRARDAGKTLPPQLLPAFLELALTEPLIKKLRKKGVGALISPVRLSPFGEQWHIWRAARRGKL